MIAKAMVRCIAAPRDELEETHPGGEIIAHEEARFHEVADEGHVGHVLSDRCTQHAVENRGSTDNGDSSSWTIGTHHLIRLGSGRVHGERVLASGAVHRATSGESFSCQRTLCRIRALVKCSLLRYNTSVRIRIAPVTMWAFNVRVDSLGEALNMRSPSPDKLMDVSNVTVLSQMVFLSRSMCFTCIVFFLSRVREGEGDRIPPLPPRTERQP